MRSGPRRPARRTSASGFTIPTVTVGNSTCREAVEETVRLARVASESAGADESIECPGKGLTHLNQAARRKGGQLLQLDRSLSVTQFKTALCVRCHGPEVKGPVTEAKFVSRMVLRKAAIGLRMRSTPRAGPQ